MSSPASPPRDRRRGATSGNAADVKEVLEERGAVRTSVEDVQKRYMAKLERRLPGGKRTRRLPVLKLEVGEGEIADQLGIVSRRVFGLDYGHAMEGTFGMPSVPSRNYQHWRIADETLFGDAKAAYDGIVIPFTKQPRVYKLESIREKVWEATRDKSEEEEAERDAEYKRKEEQLKQRRAKMDAKMKAKPPLALGAKGAEMIAKQEEEKIEFIPPAPYATKDDELVTFLDPFEPPKPWYKEVWNNKLSYFNDETKERIYTRPTGPAVFDQKLELLSKLTPRDDMNGYEYRENEAERRKRMRLMTEFDRLMQEEIHRRENEPHDVEVIEDVLYDLVEAVHIIDERRNEAIRRKEKRAVKATWHPVCKGYKMKPLIAIENESGEVETAVTDLEDFPDMIVSTTGHMVALQTPPGFYEKHEAERAVLRAIAEEKRAMEEFERNRPFKEKARIVLALARHDPKAAAKRIASGIKERALAIPRTLRSMDRKVVLQTTQRIAINGFLSLVKVGKDPRLAFNYIQERAKKIYAEMFPKEEADEEMEALLRELSGEKKEEVVEDVKVETEAERERRLWLAAQPKPVKHPDTVMVRMTFLVDPPPMFAMRPPHTWKDELVEAEAILRHQSMLAKESTQLRISKYYPQLIDAVNTGLAMLGRDAIEVDEEYHAEQLQRIDKERRRRKPLKPWQTRRDVSPPPRRRKQQQQQQQQDQLLGGETEEVTGDAEIDALLAAPGSSVESGAALDVVDPTAEGAAAAPADANPNAPAQSLDAAATTADPAPAPDPNAPPTTDELDASNAPLSPERRGRTVTIPKIGPLPPMNIYVPHRDEIRDKIKALPADMERLKERMRDRMRTLPSEVKDKVKKIIEDIKNPPVPKDVFDTRERQVFEKMLIQEVAQAIMLPAGNIQIEEIRRMDKNHPKIVALLRRNEERAEDYARRQKVKHDAYMAERERRKAAMKPPEDTALRDAAKDFLEDQAERWGLDLEKVTGGRVLRTVYKGPGWHRSKDPNAVTDFKGRPIPLTHPLHPRHDPAVHGTMLAIENGQGSNKERQLSPRPGDSGKILLEALMDKEDAVSEGSAGGAAGGGGSLSGSRPLELQDAPGSASLGSGQGRDSQLPQEIDGENSIGSKVPSSAAGSLANRRSLEQDNAAGGSLAQGAPDNGSVLSGSQPHGGNDDATHATSNTARTLRPEPISEDEVARLTAQREERLALFDEEIVNLVEQMCAEVVARDFLERKAAEYDNFHCIDSKVASSDPTQPPYFQLGIRNPEALRHDANYWLAKAIRPWTRVELRERRLTRLRMSQRKEGLELRLQQLYDLKELLLYDAREYYDENLEPFVEGVLRPAMRRLKAEASAKWVEYSRKLERLAANARSKMLAAIQQGLQALQPKPVILHEPVLSIEPPRVLTRAEIEAAYKVWWRYRTLNASRVHRLPQNQDDAQEHAKPPSLGAAEGDDQGAAAATSEIGPASAAAAPLLDDTPPPPPPPPPAPLEPYDPDLVDCCEALVSGVLSKLVAEDEERAREHLARAGRVYYDEEFLALARARVTQAWAKPQEQDSGKSARGSQRSTSEAEGSIVDAEGESEAGERTPEGGKMQVGDASSSIDGSAPVSEEQKLTGPASSELSAGALPAETEAKPLPDQAAIPESERSQGTEGAAVSATSASASTEEQGPEQECPPPQQPEHVLTPEQVAANAVEDIVQCARALLTAVAERCLTLLDGAELAAIESITLRGLSQDHSTSALALPPHPLCLQVTHVLLDVVAAVDDRADQQIRAEVTAEWLALADERAALRAKREAFEAILREQEERRLALLSSDNLRSLGRLSKEDEAALVAHEEANISDELKRLRDAQAAQKAEMEMRAKYRRLRRQRRRVYDNDVVDLLNRMCIAVELSAEYGDNPMDVLPDIEDDYDQEQGKAETESTPPTPRVGGGDVAVVKGGDTSAEGADAPPPNEDAKSDTSKQKKEPEEEEEDDEGAVLGCEVTFMIIVTDKEREEDGLQDLEAEDVAVMLLQQFDNPKSQLRSGYLGQKLLDVEYKMPFKKQLFSSWEAFWVHCIHPAFFYRTSAKSAPKKEKDNGGRLESGLLMINPTKEFSARSKETFLMYQRKYARKPKEARKGASAEEEALKAAIRAKAEAKKAKNKSVVDLNVDEFASDVKALQIVRPNLSNIDAVGVERLRRISVAFEDNYRSEMLKGMVDGERLSNKQYEALKNRDISKRIYMNAKSKFSEIRRNAGELKDPTFVPLVTTNVSTEQFEEWMDELRQEQTNNLRELVIKKAADRDLRDQESMLRRRFGKQRYWVINFKINNLPNGAEIGPAFHNQLAEFASEKQKFLLKELNDVEAAKHHAKVMKLATVTISDEKQTRLLFDVMRKWVLRKNRSLNRHRLSQEADDEEGLLDTAKVTAVLLGVGKLERDSIDKLKAGIDAMNEISEGVDEVNSDLDDEDDGEGEGGEEEEDEGEDGDEERPTSPSGAQVGLKIFKSTRFKRAGKKRLFNRKLTVPFIFRQDLLSFLEVYLTQLAAELAVAKEQAEEYELVKKEVIKDRQAKAFMGIALANSERHDIGAVMNERLRKRDLALRQELAAKNGDPNSKRNPLLREFAQTSLDIAEAAVAVLEAGETPGIRRVSRLAAAAASTAAMAASRAGVNTSSAIVAATKHAMSKLEAAGLALLPDELDACRNVHWIGVIREDENFYDALCELPFKEDPKMARDEIIQFCTILCEIVPIFGRVGRLVSKEKEEALIAAGYRGRQTEQDAERIAKGLTKKQQKELEREAQRQARAEKMPMSTEQRAVRFAEQERKAKAAGMNEEGLRRLRKMQEAERRQAQREDAWLRAHPHRFIKYPGETTFCIVCRVREYEAWLGEFNKQEKEAEVAFSEDMMDNLEDYTPQAEAEVDEETHERLIRVEEDLKEQFTYEAKVKQGDKEYKKLLKEYDRLKREAKKAGAKEPPKPGKPYYKPYDYENTTMKRWRKSRVYQPQYTEDGQEIPDGIVLSELPLVDADGVTILPPPPEEEGEVAESSDDENDGHAHETRGVRVRVWQKDGPGVKGAFLGSVLIKEAEVLEPPKGMRTYPLCGDGFVARRMEKEGKAMIPITGSLTVSLKIDKFDKVKGSDEKIPRRWRLQVVRGNKLACADRLKGITAYCEIFWMGLAIKGLDTLDYGGRWLMVGETREKPKTGEPEWGKEDNAVFELPPVWTDLDVRGRGPNGGDLKGGAWVALNHVPVPPDYSAIAEARGRPSRRRLRAAMIFAVAVVRLQKIRADARQDVVRRKIETARVLWIAEEKERRFMAREERLTRKFLIEAEELRAQPQLERQREFEREYAQLILYIKEQPRVLARLRFMMGTPCDGGMLATCEDPATHRLLNVMSVPILYPEDEEELCSQMQRLVGKQNPNLVAVIEFSVHAVRLFAQNGFPGIDQRIAMAVLERYEGESLLEYLKKDWNILTNDDFRLLLAQIVNGLADLHAEGIVHRNFHETCVILRRPSHIVAEERAMGRAVKHPPKVPNLRLGEFWFLYNPRKAGCLYSMGRADWGARSTAPPETLSGGSVDDRSDIWAFGVCVYHWATGGRTLPAVFSLDELAAHIPLKWTLWVHALLRMCLVANPRARASAEELRKFLARRVHGQI